MKLLNLSKFFFLIVYLSIFSTLLKAEDTVDIWNKKTDTNSNTPSEKSQINITKDNLEIKENSFQVIESSITESSTNKENEKELFGLFDPEKNNLNLDIWQNTDGKEIKEIFSRINKIKLSKSASDMFSDIILHVCIFN